ncbi:MAG: hypothetical protein NZ528_16055 [Caldilineales bacterium]|nr:hypothetical protein [Caldilineales bacterium]
MLVLLALLALLLPPAGQRPPADLDRELSALTAGQRFDLTAWEAAAVSSKLMDLAFNPARGLSAAQQTALVRQYLQVAQRIAQLERQIEAIYSDPAQSNPDAASQPLRDELERRRRWADRHTRGVEAVLERQLTRVLAGVGLDTAGLVWPPPRLRLTEPPQLLVVSPRERIERLRTVNLLPELTVEQRQQIEQAVAERLGLAAYVTPIGGYGAWPTMVVDRFGLPWTVETIAHEWVHNYLAFRPLGWAYLRGGEAVTINESVASLAGEELGRALMAIYYPDLLPPPPDPRPAPPPASGEPPAFDFNREMRTTRQVVDRLLAHGYVEEAEAYMEARRQRFVANGYPLRVLNQAYFAFHGSYATGPAATDPIGPKVRRLRDLSPSLADFLRTASTVTTAAELDAALERLERAGCPEGCRLSQGWQP